ncbi:MAG: ribonuclease HIII [FCB group bacterium]|nr:ribonuclease HIII [FCB group bacterium]
MTVSDELHLNFIGVVDFLASKGFKLESKKVLINGIQAVFSRNGNSCKFNFYYSKKKGFSIVQAGGNSTALNAVSMLLKSGTESNTPMEGTWIGTDEAGKGDYMGALTVGAVFCNSETAEKLLQLGSNDSKKLTDSSIRKIAAMLKNELGSACTTVSIEPREYNREFLQLKNIGKNSLDMLAGLHGLAIKKLIQTGIVPDRIIIDRFCPEERIEKHLPKGQYELELRIHGEDDPAVATASILARDAYLDSLERIRKKYHLPVSAGSGVHTDVLVAAFVQSFGRNVLDDIVKMHFKNTSRLNGDT